MRVILALYLVDNSKLYSPLWTKTTIKPEFVISALTKMINSLRSQWVVFWSGYMCVTIKKQCLGTGYNN